MFPHIFKDSFSGSNAFWVAVAVFLISLGHSKPPWLKRTGDKIEKTSAGNWLLFKKIPRPVYFQICPHVQQSCGEQRLTRTWSVGSVGGERHANCSRIDKKEAKRPFSHSYPGCDKKRKWVHLHPFKEPEFEEVFLLFFCCSSSPADICCSVSKDQRLRPSVSGRKRRDYVEVTTPSTTGSRFRYVAQ